MEVQMVVLDPGSTRALRGVPCAVFDFETTGPDPRSCRPVQVAVVHTELGDTEPQVVFKSLIRPGVPIPEGAQAVHGIGDDDVADAPGWAEVLPLLLTHLEGRALAAFNLPFDWQILLRGLLVEGGDAGSLPFGALDPLVWTKVVHKYERGKRLSDVAERYGVHLDAHDAAGDALATALIMPRLLHDLGRHQACGRDPLLSVGAMWSWTQREGIAADDGYAAWRKRQGQEPPTLVWRELVDGWAPPDESRWT